MLQYTVERSFVNDRFARVLKSGAIVWRKTWDAASKFSTLDEAETIAARANTGALHSASARRYGYAA